MTVETSDLRKTSRTHADEGTLVHSDELPGGQGRHVNDTGDLFELLAWASDKSSKSPVWARPVDTRDGFDEKGQASLDDDAHPEGASHKASDARDEQPW